MRLHKPSGYFQEKGSGKQEEGKTLPLV